MLNWIQKNWMWIAIAAAVYYVVVYKSKGGSSAATPSALATGE